MQIYLIRHGEVENPGDVVYADIPGFTLSAAGRKQAEAAGKHLAGSPPQLIVSSPLDRAVATAELIAAETGAGVVTEPRLTEWALAVRWRGARWADLPVVFPGELEAYLAHPGDLPFCSESVTQVAERMASAVTHWVERADRDIAFISHQDPIHSAKLRLSGVPMNNFHDGKPAHCTVVAMQPAGPHWATVSEWSPPQ